MAKSSSEFRHPCDTGNFRLNARELLDSQRSHEQPSWLLTTSFASSGDAMGSR